MSYFVDKTDKRNQVLTQLLQNDGYEVFEYNLSNLKNIKTNDILIFAPNKKFDINEALQLPNDIKIFLGNVSEEVQKIFGQKNIKYTNILQDEIFAIKNAKLTAEGILAIVLSQSEKSIFENKILILGAGRVGKATASLFQKIGINCSLVSHNQKKFAENFLFVNNSFFKDGFKNQIKNFDIIINTIPAKVLNQETIKTINKNTIFIEIASVNTLNFDEAQNFVYIIAPALPQKYSCETAGKLMFESIMGLNKI